MPPNHTRLCTPYPIRPIGTDNYLPQLVMGLSLIGAQFDSIGNGDTLSTPTQQVCVLAGEGGGC